MMKDHEQASMRRDSLQRALSLAGTGRVAHWQARPRSKGRCKEQPITVNVSNARFSLIREVAEELGYRVIDDESDDGDILWCVTTAKRLGFSK